MNQQPLNIKIALPAGFDAICKPEIAFLRFFFEKAGQSMGPTARDIYRSLMEEFRTNTGMPLMPAYIERFFNDEEDKQGE